MVSVIYFWVSLFVLMMAGLGSPKIPRGANVNVHQILAKIDYSQITRLAANCRKFSSENVILLYLEDN